MALLCILGEIMKRDELKRAIAEIEQKSLTYENVEKLAHLYSLYDRESHREYRYSRSDEPEEPQVRIIRQKEPVHLQGDSEFIKLLQRKDFAEAMTIIDELMEVLYITNERLYNGVMRKLEDLE